MKTKTIGLALAYFLVAILSHGAEIRVGFTNVPPSIACGDSWTNQNVILSFTETVAGEDGSGGSCYFGVQPDSVDLYPCRLKLDFSLLGSPVSHIEADIYDYCGPGCTLLFAYLGTTNIGSSANPVNHSNTLSLNFSTYHPTSCALRSYEANIQSVRITTLDLPRLQIVSTGAVISITWPTNQLAFMLEASDAMGAASAWNSQTNGVVLQGGNHVFQISDSPNTKFFRLRASP